MDRVVSLFDERALRELVEAAAERAIRKVLRGAPSRTDADGRWVPVAQLAAKYSLAPGTIRRWAREGRVRSIRVGGAQRVSVEDFERVISGSTANETREPSPEELADRDEARERRSRRG
jgi:hypothetical protein